MKFTLSRANLIWLAVIFCCVAFLLIEAYAGTFSRYMADDYCYGYRTLTRGFLGSADWWYNNWTGRFTFNILMGIAISIGEPVVSVLPTIILAYWFAALVWTCYQIMQLMGAQRPLYYAVVFSLFIQFAIFAGAPNIIQSLYWIGGDLLYTSPVITIILLIGIIAASLRRAQNGLSI